MAGVGCRVGWSCGRQEVRASVLCLGLLIALCVAVRAACLDSLPPFADETTRVAAAHMNAGALLSQFRSGCHVGKPAIVLQLALFSHLPLPLLVAVRLSSLLFGVGSVIVLYLIGRDVWVGLGHRRSWVAGGLVAAMYICSPMACFYDRLAVPDSGSFLATALLLWISQRLFGGCTVPRLLVLAAAVGLGLFMRLGNAILVPFPFLFVALSGERHRLRSWVGVLMAVLLPVLCIFPLVNALGAFPVGQIDQKVAWSFARIPVYLCGAWEAVWRFHTPGMALLLSAGVLLPLLPGFRALLPWTLAGLWVLVLQAGGMAVWFPRYLFGQSPAFFVLAGVALACICSVASARGGGRGWRRWGAVVCVLLLLLPGLHRQLRMVVNPESVPLPAGVEFQYISGWPSGYGLREARAAVLSSRCAMGCVDVHVMRVSTDTVSKGVYLFDTPENYPPWPESFCAEAIAALAGKGHTVLLLINSPRVPLPTGRWEEGGHFARPHEGEGMRLYRAVSSPL